MRRRAVLRSGVVVTTAGFAGCRAIPAFGNGQRTETGDEGDEADGEDEDETDDDPPSRNRWQFFQSNRANSGRGQGGFVQGVSQRWAIRGAGSVASSPTVVDGTCYVGSGEESTGAVHAIDVRSGEERWRIETNPVFAAPTRIGDTVYAVSSPRTLADGDQATCHALAAASGEERWTVDLEHRTAFAAPAVDHDSTSVFVSSTTADFAESTLTALDVASGEERWTAEVGGPGTPAVARDTIYVGTGRLEGGAVTALSTATGEERWQVDVETGVFASPTLVGDTLYVATLGTENFSYVDAGGRLLALSTADGRERWRFETDGALFGSPAHSGRALTVGVLTAEGEPGAVLAVDTTDGTERWRMSVEGDIISSPAVDDSTVYVGATDGTLYALETADGGERWRFTTGDAINSSPAVLDRRLYVGSDDRHVYALEPGSGDARSSVADRTPTEDRDPEPRLQILVATGTSIRDAGVGEVQLSVRIAPDSGPVDLSNTVVQWVGPSGTYHLRASSTDENEADGYFGIEPFQDANDSAPVLDDPDDRFVLVFDLGTDDRDVDDPTDGGGEGVTYFGERLREDATVSLRLIVESGASTTGRLQVPESLAGEDAVRL